MYRRILFLTTAQSGSTYFVRLLTGKEGHPFDAYCPRWLKTDPAEQCTFYHAALDRHHEDPVSWDKRDVNQITGPEAYATMYQPHWDKDWFDALPGNNWKFVYLMRDPRNKIQSYMVKRVRKHNLHDDVFVREIELFKQQAQSINTMRNDPNFKIFKFEDLIANPVDVLSDMFSFAGLGLDHQFYWDFLNTSGASDTNTTFPEDPQVNQRWHIWSPEQIRVFKQIAGQEIIDLGYERDGGWSIP